MWIRGESKKTKMPTRKEALPGHDTKMPVFEHHLVHGKRTGTLFPEGLETVDIGTGEIGHNDLVRIVFDPTKVSLEMRLQAFWENHDPTQGMHQDGNIAAQYRSGICPHSAHQHHAALDSRTAYLAALTNAGKGAVTAESLDAPEFFYAEECHQQYLAKNPDGYCGLGGTGVSCPVGLSLS